MAGYVPGSGGQVVTWADLSGGGWGTNADGYRKRSTSLLQATSGTL